VKDPKKQEAGRKGAAARRPKLEVLTAELAAAKKAVFSCEATNNEEHVRHGIGYDCWPFEDVDMKTLSMFAEQR